MAQPSVLTYFNTRKRGIEDELIQNKKKVICLDKTPNFSESNDSQPDSDDVTAKIVFSKASSDVSDDEPRTSKVVRKAATRQGITPQRATRSKKLLHMQEVDGIDVPKLVNFWKGGNLSPQKKSKAAKPVETETDTGSKPSTSKIEEAPCGFKTPVKKCNTDTILKTSLVPVNAMKVDEIKKKLKNSSRLADLKTSINRLNNGFDKLNQMEKKRLEAAPIAPKTLKPFKSIELEILSPSKRLLSPMKLKDSPMKNTLLGSPKILTPKRLFSPTKLNPLQMSPVKAPAFQRFQNLAEAGTPTLQLPYKHRYILDIFVAVETVCAMFFNRKEKITLKKLKPAVQRILRKNFYESHLAQINHLMPDAYRFSQEKTRNYGSTSKADYYQLVISPNIAPSTEDLKQLTLTPQALIERKKKMTEILTDLVFNEHEKFLQTLEVPMSVTRKALKRWHPEFNLEGVKDVEQKQLPQPPNVEKFSAAKDILSTARNLFNCSTPMERALERMEEKKKEEKLKQAQNEEQQEAKTSATPVDGKNSPSKELKKNPTEVTTSSILKGVPQSLLDKIRAKQAAKALDAMTRRPSQEREAVKYSRLPEIARHARNVFVTEKKGVLLLELVMKKIENSYKGCVELKEIEELLKLISKLLPTFMSFHEIRCAMYVKLSRDSDLTDVVAKLEKMAADKSKIH